MLTIKRSGSRKFWHVMYNNVMVECCTSKRDANVLLNAYKKIVTR